MQSAVVGEVHLTFARCSISLDLDVLVVDNLDVDILAGTPFMITNDISLRPAKQQITILGQETCYHGTTNSPSSSENPSSIRCTGYGPPCPIFLFCRLAWTFPRVRPSRPYPPDSILAIEPRRDCSKSTCDWPPPALSKLWNERSAYPTKPINQNVFSDTTIFVRSYLPTPQILLQGTPSFQTLDSLPPSPSPHSIFVQLDPDSILPEGSRPAFNQILAEYDDVFDKSFSGYNGAAGQFEAVVNMHGFCTTPTTERTTSSVCPQQDGSVTRKG